MVGVYGGTGQVHQDVVMKKVSVAVPKGKTTAVKKVAKKVVKKTGK